MKEKQIKKLEYIKNSMLLPNITNCSNCRKSIDISKDFYMFGTSLNDDFIYCSEHCNSWHFSVLMY